MDSLDSIWIINLKQDKKKRQILEKQIENLSLTYNFLESVDGNHLENINFKVLKKWKEPFTGKQITKGEIGCALSHIKLWKKVPENKYIIILEDDVILTKEFEEKLVLYMEYLIENKHIDFCYLGRKHYHKNNEEVVNYNTKLIKSKYSGI